MVRGCQTCPYSENLIYARLSQKRHVRREVLTVIAHCHFDRDGDGDSGVFQLDLGLCRVGTLPCALRVRILSILSILLQAVRGLLSPRTAVYELLRVQGGTVAQDPLHGVVKLADLVVLAVVPEVALLGQQILPLEALDAHPALLRRPLEAHRPQSPGHVSVHEAVSEVSIQSCLDVLLAPDVQQRPGLHVRPQEAPCCVGLHSGSPSQTRTG